MQMMGKDKRIIGMAIAFFALIITLFMPVVKTYGKTITLLQLLRGADGLDAAGELPYVGEIAGSLGAFVVFLIIMTVLCAIFPLIEGLAMLLVKGRSVLYIAGAGILVNIILKVILGYRVHQANAAAGSLVSWFSDDVNIFHLSVPSLAIWILGNLAVLILMISCFVAPAGMSGAGYPTQMRRAPYPLPQGGYPQHRPTEPRRAPGLRCPYCGGENWADMNFCTRCGRPLR